MIIPYMDALRFVSMPRCCFCFVGFVGRVYNPLLLCDKSGTDRVEQCRKSSRFGGRNLIAKQLPTFDPPGFLTYPAGALFEWMIFSSPSLCDHSLESNPIRNCQKVNGFVCEGIRLFLHFLEMSPDSSPNGSLQYYIPFI